LRQARRLSYFFFGFGAGFGAKLQPAMDFLLPRCPVDFFVAGNGGSGVEGEPGAFGLEAGGDRSQKTIE
jgi:hypothetical protein